MTETLFITCGGLKEGIAEYTAYWRTTYPSNVAPTKVRQEEEDEEPKIIDFFTTNTKGDRIKKYNIGDTIYVNIKTKNKIGHIIEINLKDKTKDFKYKGAILENDSLNYEIKSNNEKVALEVVIQN